MNYFLVALFVLIVEMVRELIFSKTLSGRKNIIISFSSLIAMVLVPYFLETIYLIVICEIVILIIWIYCIKKQKAETIEY